jgi:hypothetical protein
VLEGSALSEVQIYLFEPPVVCGHLLGDLTHLPSDLGE